MFQFLIGRLDAQGGAAPLPLPVQFLRKARCSVEMIESMEFQFLIGRLDANAWVSDNARCSSFNLRY